MHKILLFGLALTALILAIFGGCDQRITTPARADYIIYGAVVKNLDNDSGVASALFAKNDTAVTAGTIWFGKDTLEYSSGYYLKTYSHPDSLHAGSFRLNVINGGSLRDSVAFMIPDTTAITSISPDSRINAGGSHQVNISWLTASGSNGYVYGVVKRDSAYISDGYSAFVTSQVTSATIPPDAFRLSGNLDTGWYYIYVYAYYGAPAEMRDLPTAFPVGLAANIAKLDITGYWGAVTVSRRDSMYVTILGQ